MDSDDELLGRMMDAMEEAEEGSGGSQEEDWTDTGWAQPPDHISSMLHGGTGTRQKSHGSLSRVEVDKEKKEEPSDPSVVKRMLLNDNKAGMQGLDKDRINQIIHEASKGSKFYENERQKEEQMKKRIEEQKRKISTITDAQLKEGLIEADRLLEDFDQQRDLSHTIVHTDMDAFYAAVEMRDKPELKHKPMAVGGTAMLSTSNYEARKFGVRAAMPGFIAKKLCPDLIIVPTNFDKYTAVSKQVRDIFTEYDPNFCPMSLDEAYLDITQHLVERQAMSEQERTYVCRNRAYTHSIHHCLCDLNDIVRNVGTKLMNFGEGNKDAGNLDTNSNCSKDTKDAIKLDNNSVGLNEGCKDGINLGSNNVCSGAEAIQTSFDIHNYLMGGRLYDNIKEADAAAAAMAAERETESSTGSQGKQPLCPVCLKEFPPFHSVRFGLTDEDAVNELRARIEQKTRLTASAGIAPNMMLAKVCSDRNKPNGQYKVLPTKAAVIDFIKDLPTRKISGIGKVSEAMLNALGVYTCTQLYEQRALLYHLYSPISFNYFMRICLGIGSTTVERDSERKSISTERTFSELSRPADLYHKCEELCDSLAEDLKTEQLKGKTVGIKIKTVKFEVKTKAHTLREYTSDRGSILKAATELLRTEIQACAPQPLRLRLMGVRMSNLLPESHCGGKKQRTILGAFKKLSEKAGQNQTNQCVDTGSGASDFVSGSVVKAHPVPLPSDPETLLNDKPNVPDLPNKSDMPNLPKINNLPEQCEVEKMVKDQRDNDVNLDVTDERTVTLKAVIDCPALGKEEKNDRSLHAQLGTMKVDFETVCDSDCKDGYFVKAADRYRVNQDDKDGEKDGESDYPILSNNGVKQNQDGKSDFPLLSDNHRISDSIGTSISHVYEMEDTLKATVDEGVHKHDLKVDKISACVMKSNLVSQTRDIKHDSISDVTKHNQDEKVCGSKGHKDIRKDVKKARESGFPKAQETLKGKNELDLNNCDSRNSTPKSLERVVLNEEQTLQDTLTLNDGGDRSAKQLEGGKQYSTENDSNVLQDDAEQVEEEKQSSGVSDAKVSQNGESKTAQSEIIVMNGRGRTRSGVVCTPNKPSAKKRRNSKRDQSVSYSCPVCTKDILCANLNEFNRHVDECLNKNATVESEPDQNCDKAKQGETDSCMRLSDTNNHTQSEAKGNVKTDSKTNKEIMDNISVEHDSEKQWGGNEDNQSVNCKNSENKMMVLATSKQDEGSDTSRSLTNCEEQFPGNSNACIGTDTKSNPDNNTSPHTKSDDIYVCDKYVARASTSKENICDNYIARPSTSKEIVELEYIDKSSVKDGTNPEETNDLNSFKQNVMNENVTCDQGSNDANENDLQDDQGSVNCSRKFHQSVLEKPGTSFSGDDNYTKLLNHSVDKKPGPSCSDDYNNNKESPNQATVDCKNNDRKSDHCSYNLQVLSSKKIAIFDYDNGQQHPKVATKEANNQIYVDTNIEYNDFEVAKEDTYEGEDSDNDDTGAAGLLVCPICNTGQRCGNLADFNDHVDACLSRGAIKEILQEQRKKEAKPQKRPSLSPVVSGSQPNKRRKTVLPPQKPVPCRTIASFFKDK